MPTSWRADTMVAAAQRPKRRRRGIHHATFHRSNRLGSNRLGLRRRRLGRQRNRATSRVPPPASQISPAPTTCARSPLTCATKNTARTGTWMPPKQPRWKPPRAARMAAAYAPGDPNRTPPEKGVPIDQRSYDWFWMDPGDTMFKIDGKYRTSIIVDSAERSSAAALGGRQAHRAALAKKAEGRGPLRRSGTADAARPLPLPRPRHGSRCGR